MIPMLAVKDLTRSLDLVALTGTNLEGYVKTAIGKIGRHQTESDDREECLGPERARCPTQVARVREACVGPDQGGGVLAQDQQLVPLAHLLEFGRHTLPASFRRYHQRVQLLRGDQKAAET